MIQFGDLDWSPLFEIVGWMFALFLEPDPVQIAIWVLGVIFGSSLLVKTIRRRRR